MCVKKGSKSLVALVVIFLLLFLQVTNIAFAGVQHIFTSQTPEDYENNTRYELGTKFKTTVNGRVIGVRIYTNELEGGEHAVRIWNAGTGLNVSGTHIWNFEAGKEGWKTYYLPHSLEVTANTDYIVSVSNSEDKWYPYKTNGFSSPILNGNLQTYQGSGVFSTTLGSMPQSVYNNTNYFRDVIFVPSSDYADYQAENGTYSGAVFSSANGGYTGSGYVDFTGGTGSYIQWNVTASSPGAHRLTFRYANGSVDQPLKVTVNGDLANSKLPLPNTGSWSDWQEVSTLVFLQAGTNTVRIETIPESAGANIDRMTVISGVRPDASNTGPSDPSVLVPYTGASTILTEGITLENYIFTKQINIAARNVTIRNFRMELGGTNKWGFNVTSQGQNVLIEDGEIDGQTPLDALDADTSGICLCGHQGTVRRVHIHTVGQDAIASGGNNFLVELNYAHDVDRGKDLEDPNQSMHGDAFQSAGTSNGIIRGNNFDLQQRGNSAIILKTDDNVIDNILIDANYLNGGNYTIFSRKKNNTFGPPTNVRITNNRFGRDHDEGVVSYDGTIVWLNNVDDLTGNPL